MNMNEENTCTRKVIKIGKENYYLIVGDTFVMVTVPRENDPTMTQERKVVETLCAAITEVMEKRGIV